MCIDKPPSLSDDKCVFPIAYDLASPVTQAEHEKEEEGIGPTEASSPPDLR